MDVATRGAAHRRARSWQGLAATGTPAPAPLPRRLRPAAEQEERHRDSREQSGMSGSSEPAKDPAGLGDMKPELAAQVTDRGVARIDEAVVVPFEEVMVVLN